MIKGKPGSTGSSAVAIILSSIALAVSVLGLVFHFTQVNKIVYVDSLTLMKGYKGMQAAKVELEGKIAAYQDNVDTLKLEFDQRLAEYNANKEKLKESELKLFEELLSGKESQLTSYQQMVQEKIQAENLALTNSVLLKINDYIKRYSQRNNIDIVLAATQYGNVIYGNEDVEVTNIIIEGLNEEYDQGK